MKKISSLILATLSGAVILTCGCDSFEYSGQNFPELPEEVAIKIFWKEREVDHDQFRMIGKGIYTADDSMDRFDIEEKLADYAREHGAEAVSVVKVNNITKGLQDRNEVNFDKEVKAEPKKDSKSDKKAEPPKDKVFGEEIQLRGEEHGVSKKEIFVIFWKNKAEADKILSEREKKLDKQIDGNWNGDK